LRDFCIALLNFAEWDDFSRPSYVWPFFIRTLIFEYDRWSIWIKNIQNDFLLSKVLHRSKLYLLALCLEHIGAADQYDFKYVDESKLTDSICSLIEGIREVTDIEDEEAIRRSSSRFGSEFQVDDEMIGSFESRDNLFAIDETLYPGGMSENALESGYGLVYRPSTEQAEILRIDKYLSDVSRINNLKSGQIIERRNANDSSKTGSYGTILKCEWKSPLSASLSSQGNKVR
jgi:hypothetical protein